MSNTAMYVCSTYNKQGYQFLHCSTLVAACKRKRSPFFIVVKFAQPLALILNRCSQHLRPVPAQPSTLRKKLSCLG